MGFGAGEQEMTPVESVERAVREALAPELWNRFDERLILHPLDRSQLGEISRLLLSDSSDRLFREKRIEYRVCDEVIEHLTQQASLDTTLGARTLRQLIQRLLEGPIAQRILAGEFSAGDSIRVAFSAGQLTFARAARRQ